MGRTCSDCTNPAVHGRRCEQCSWARRKASGGSLALCRYCGTPTATWASKAPIEGASHPRCRPVEHGTRKMYREHGCRCDDCRGWNRGAASVYGRMVTRRDGRSLSSKYRPNRGRFVARAVRLEIYERDGWVCQLCAQPVDRDLPANDRMAASLDHVVPQSTVLFPNHAPSNLRLAHRSCNAVRGPGRPLVEAS